MTQKSPKARRRSALRVLSKFGAVQRAKALRRAVRQQVRILFKLERVNHTIEKQTAYRAELLSAVEALMVRASTASSQSPSESGEDTTSGPAIAGPASSDESTTSDPTSDSSPTALPTSTRRRSKRSVVAAGESSASSTASN